MRSVAQVMFRLTNIAFLSVMHAIWSSDVFVDERCVFVGEHCVSVGQVLRRRRMPVKWCLRQPRLRFPRYNVCFSRLSDVFVDEGCVFFGEVCCRRYSLCSCRWRDVLIGEVCVLVGKVCVFISEVLFLLVKCVVTSILVVVMCVLVGLVCEFVSEMLFSLVKYVFFRR